MVPKGLKIRELTEVTKKGLVRRARNHHNNLQVHDRKNTRTKLEIEKSNSQNRCFGELGGGGLI